MVPLPHPNPNPGGLLLVRHRALGSAELAGAVRWHDAHADHGGRGGAQQAPTDQVARAGVGPGGGGSHATPLVGGPRDEAFDGGREGRDAKFEE